VATSAMACMPSSSRPAQAARPRFGRPPRRIRTRSGRTERGVVRGRAHEVVDPPNGRAAGWAST
jgi:hypothetical protein